MVYAKAMTAKELYLYALDQATAVVAQVGDDQLELPTPDTEWQVRDLLAHITYELAWTADIVAGKTTQEVGDRYDGDLLGDDHVAAWRRYEASARTAVEASDEQTTAHLSYGDKPVAEYLQEAATDQLVHAWDLGQAVGVSVVFDEPVARALYERVVSRKDELAGSGLFGPAVEVPDSADAQTKLLALLGRSADWRTRTQ